MLSSDGPPEFKAIVVGDTAVGKTSIILRFHHNVFLPDHRPTVGGSYITKVLNTPSGPANLNLWDTAGQERYRSLVPMYCRGAHVAILVFDLSDHESFLALDKWLEQVKGTASEHCTIIVVGNKLDLPAAVMAEEVNDWAMSKSVTYCAVSALSGIGVSQLFNEVAKSLQKYVNTPLTESISEGRLGGCC